MSRRDDPTPTLIPAPRSAPSVKAASSQELGSNIRSRSVCLYTPSADPSGMGTHMLDLAAEYAPTLDVSLMAWATVPGRRVLEQAAALGVRAVPLPPPRDPGFADTIGQFLSKHPADVFHIHVGTGREDFDGARAARRAGVPVVVQTQHQPWLFRDHRKISRMLCALAPVDHVIMVSNAQRRTYERIGSCPERITTVPNGIRPRGSRFGRAAARSALGLRPDQLVVLTVGRLAVQKGQRYLLDAVPELTAHFPDVVIVILGDGHLRDQLRGHAARLGVGDRVRLPGYRADARRMLDAADVFVLPSRQEGMPLAALEAMDAGLPVVATRVIGTAEVVVHGETGLLVPPENPSALAAAVAELLADADLRGRYGREGRRCYRKRFTSRRMAEETVAVYDRMLLALDSELVGSTA